METEVVMTKIDTEITKTDKIELCREDIVGARPVYYAIRRGDKVKFEANVGYYHILILIGGEATFENDGTTVTFTERTVFIPSPDKELTVRADADTAILEIQWDIAAGDAALLAEYGTKFPVVQKYVDSIQYIDPNKSQKTISRMMIPQRIIPRFSIGSVESYGHDMVRPHSHPMLDQFFFSFPENDMDVIINGKHLPMAGNIILHIPLGADHGVEVYEGKHMHYMWIDFMPDNELGLKRLDASHKVTGTMRSFDDEQK